MTFNLPAYRDFISAKGKTTAGQGFAPHGSWPGLFEHQRRTLKFACETGRTAAFLDTGLGKSRVEAAFADEARRKTNKPSLILTPLAVARQMQRECEAVGVEARVIREDADVWPGVNIANYERLGKLDVTRFGGVVLDECFAAGTPVSVVDEGGSVSERRIENIRAGDMILNAAGVDTVSDVHRRPVPYAIRITVGSSVFVCSPNHPIFTERGWTPAQCLLPGDRALVTGAAVRLVRDDILPEISSAATRTILRAILLSEMADAPAGDCGESSLAGGGGEARSQEVGLVSVGGPDGAEGIGADRCAKSAERPGSPSENLPPIESHEARTFRAWGQWDWADGTAGVHAGCAWRRLDGGVSFVTGATDTGLSDALQARFGAAGEENRRRGGWTLPREPEGSGREKRREAGLVGVDRLEVLEPGHPDLESLRDADGQLYFYDLGGTRHPSFTVCGLLVHNSSILKSFSGQTKTALVRAFADTPYRLAATATPAPNDHMELGTHSEFLGYLGSMEMLCRWFINDAATASQDWRLKGHAIADFWSWVASWARAASLPSDLGGDDTGYLLPALRYHVHGVSPDLSEDTGGLLFRIPDQSATSIHKEKRLTLADRVAKCVEVVTGSFCDKLAAWHGNQNTQQNGALKQPPTPSIAPSETLREMELTLRNGPNTCADTTAKTGKNGSAARKRKPSSTQDGESDISPIRTSPSSARKLPAPDAPSQSEMGDCGPTTELASSDTIKCSPSKMDDVPSAAESIATKMVDGCTSTIATQPALSGGCSVQPATWPSESSTTISTASMRRSPTWRDQGLEPWLVFCETNDEQDALEKAFGGLCISIRGSDPVDKKEADIARWLNGERPIFVSKPSIVGYGLNFQHCSNIIFVSISHSYERFYQAVRRVWRFGQAKPVDCHVIVADTERPIWANVQRKAADHDKMKRAMATAMVGAQRTAERKIYERTAEVTLPKFMRGAA